MTGRDATVRGTGEKKSSARDLGTILHLLRQATDTLAAAEDRIRLLQARNEQLHEIVTGELDAVHASLASAEAWAIRAQVRAGLAESVAHELRGWVDRLSNSLDEVSTRSEHLTDLTTTEACLDGCFDRLRYAA